MSFQRLLPIVPAMLSCWLLTGCWKTLLMPPAMQMRQPSVSRPIPPNPAIAQAAIAWSQARQPVLVDVFAALSALEDALGPLKGQPAGPAPTAARGQSEKRLIEAAAAVRRIEAGKSKARDAAAALPPLERDIVMTTDRYLDAFVPAADATITGLRGQLGRPPASRDAADRAAGRSSPFYTFWQARLLGANAFFAATQLGSSRAGPAFHLARAVTARNDALIAFYATQPQTREERTALSATMRDHLVRSADAGEFGENIVRQGRERLEGQTLGPWEQTVLEIYSSFGDSFEIERGIRQTLVVLAGLIDPDRSAGVPADKILETLERIDWELQTGNRLTRQALDRRAELQDLLRRKAQEMP